VRALIMATIRRLRVSSRVLLRRTCGESFKARAVIALWVKGRSFGSLSETAMFRFKTIIGPNLKCRAIDNQKTEAAVALRCLNTFTACGMPVSVKVA